MGAGCRHEIVMTDEEIKEALERNPKLLALLEAAKDAGYRAAMRDANGLFEELDQSGQSLKKMWAKMGDWLEEQVKKEGA
jgi:hypothetical protein